jgi:hypothetical protein
VNDRLERTDYVAIICRRRYEHLSKPRRTIDDQRVEQTALAAEVVVERGLGDPGRLHDLLHADGIVAAFAPELEGVGQDDVAVLHGSQYTERYRRAQVGQVSERQRPIELPSVVGVSRQLGIE